MEANEADVCTTTKEDICDAPFPESPLITRQPAEYLCLIPRDSYMSKNGHLGPYINTHQKSYQLYCHSSRVDYITLNTNIY